MSWLVSILAILVVTGTVLPLVRSHAWWETQLRELERSLPHCIKVPQDNTYGMLLYSRYRLHEPEVRYLLEDTVPSIVAGLELEDVGRVTFFGLHPRPPRPGQDTDDRAEADAIVHDS